MAIVSCVIDCRTAEATHAKLQARTNHSRASVLARFEDLPRDGPARHRCLSGPPRIEGVDADTPRRSPVELTVVSYGILCLQAQ